MFANRGIRTEPMASALDPSRRNFLMTSTRVLAAAMASPGFAQNEPRGSGERPLASGAARKIPIGVFDPAFPDMPLDEMLEKFSGWGVEAGGRGNRGHSGEKNRASPGV